MDDEQPGCHQPKISDVEVVFGVLIFGFFDLIGVLLIAIGLDDFFILDLLVATEFVYFYIKQISMLRPAIALVFEVFPYVGALPLYSIGWLATVYADRHPESHAVQALEKTAAVMAAAQTRKTATKRGEAATLRNRTVSSQMAAEEIVEGGVSRDATKKSLARQPSTTASNLSMSPEKGFRSTDNQTLAEMAGEDRDVFETLQKESFDPERALVSSSDEFGNDQDGPYLDGNTVDLGEQEAV